MAIKALFKSRIPSMFYVLKSGKPAYFISGRFSTDVESEVAELLEECKSGNPHIYIDQNESEVDSEALSPLEIIKRKAVEEFLANQKAATAGTRDLGKSDNGDFSKSLGTTASTGELSAESTSADAAPGSPVPVSGPNLSALASLRAKISK